MQQRPRIHILDCTVRDGAYLKNQQVSAEDTRRLTALAEAAGFDYVEVGHGLGVGGYRKAEASPISDVDFCTEASQAVQRVKWGTFCIAGLCSLEELQQVLATKPDFVRIGIDPGMIDAALVMLRIVQESKTTPMAFFMKSYAWERDALLEAARTCLAHGVTTLYVVDSAGTMIPEDVSSLIGALVSLNPHGNVGFHGHNNLGLAVANSISAIRAGATMIDCSLMGVGRSSGNCVMEQLLFACMRYEIETGVDVYKVLEFSEKQLPTIYPNVSVTPADIVFGYSGFHSFYAKRARAAAEQHQVSYYHLIVELCRLTKGEPSDADILMAVEQVRAHNQSRITAAVA